MIAKIKEKLTYYQIIAIVYVLIIVFGALMLMLPFASKSGEATPFINALFTSTSATCVTGLIVYDTFLHWSIFGQIVILILIQIGGIGFMTIMTMFSIVIRRQISLSEKTLFIQSTGNNPIGGTATLIKQVVLGTFIFETVGALLLATRFIPKFGWGMGIYASIFHSISAFCNAGFDITGMFGTFSSLTPFVGDVVVNFTIMFLIVMGGIGFLVWGDIIRNKANWKKLSLHSKIVLFSSGVLILGGALLFLLFEYNSSLKGLNVGQKLMASLFQSISPRTAGFNTVPLDQLSESGRLLTNVLMFIGGSSGSTAGGIKTTTFVVLILSIIAHIKRKNNITINKRKLEDSVIPQATAIAMLYLTSIIVASLAICAIQPLLLEDVMFEVVSAIGTVGLTLGITTQLEVASKLIIMFLMYGGRVGMLSLVMIFAKKAKNVPLTRPIEKIVIG